MGIGFAVAKQCAADGANLVLVSRHKADLEKALGELAATQGQHHSYHELDVSDRGAVEGFSNGFTKKHGQVDGLVNCAGIYGPIGMTENVDLDAFEATFKINFLGTLYVCHYFLPLLEKSTRAKIVNFAGGGAASPFPNYSAYSVSKVSIVRLTENIALEHADMPLDANSIAPGFVATRLHKETISAGEKAGSEFLKKTAEMIDQGGVPPERAAKLTAFLLSEEADGITGKFLSAPWDPWEDRAFQERLKKEKGFCTLRRIDDKDFMVKHP